VIRVKELPESTDYRLELSVGQDGFVPEGRVAVDEFRAAYCCWSLRQPPRFSLEDSPVQRLLESSRPADLLRALWLFEQADPDPEGAPRHRRRARSPAPPRRGSARANGRSAWNSIRSPALFR
jgi:hypothetical protein